MSGLGVRKPVGGRSRRQHPERAGNRSVVERENWTRPGHHEPEGRFTYNTSINLAHRFAKGRCSGNHLSATELDFDGTPPSIRKCDDGIDLFTVRVAVVPNLAAERCGENGEVVNHSAFKEEPKRCQVAS